MFSLSSKGLLLGLIGLTAVGCSTTPEFQAEFETKTTQPRTVELLGNGDAEDMAIFGKESNVKVGDSASHAASVFPSPTAGAYEIHNLPYVFSNKFEAQGWETARGEGYGVILYENKVVGALYQLEHVREDQVREMEQDQISGMEPLRPKLIESGSLKYWFWTSKDQLTMMCEFTTKDGINFTLAMGDKNVMKAMAISEEDTKKQIAEVERVDAQSPAT